MKKAPSPDEMAREPELSSETSPGRGGGRGRWLPVVIAAGLLALMGLFVSLRLELSNDITEFLAADDDLRMVKLSRELAESELTKSTILVIDSESDAEGEGSAQALTAASALVEMLAEHEEVAWVRDGWEADQNQAIWEMYFPRRFYLASSAPEDELAEEVTPQGLSAAAVELKRQLSLPTGDLLKQAAPRDPLLWYPGLLERLEAARAGPLRLVDDRFVTQSGGAVVFFASVHSPFSTQHQGPLQDALAARFAQINTEAGGGLSLRQSGVGRFSLRAESRIRGDITRISILSSVGVVLLFLLVFRSPRLMLLSAVPLGAGVLTALTVCLLLFGQLHGLTLAFGASMIGICIDYPVHLFNHHTLGHDAGRAAGGARASVRRVRAGLVLGALTTVAGFAGLGWTSFPGVREIAVFASVGILAALATTLWVLPVLMPESPVPGRLHLRMAAWSGRALAAMQRRRRLLFVPPVAVLVVIGVAAPRLVFNDDASALISTEQDLLAEDEEVRAQVSRMDAGRMVIAFGDDEEQALRRNDQAYAQLAEAEAAGELAEFRSLHSFLWSRELQERNLAVLRARSDAGALERDFDTTWTEAGFRTRMFAPFFADLGAVTGSDGAGASGAVPGPLTWDELAASPLETAVRSMRTELGDEVALLTLVRGVEDVEALRERFASLDGIEVFDRKSMMAALYERHRSTTIRLVSLGLLGVFVMVLIRYRRVGPALAAFLPALLAAGGTVGLLVLMGFELGLLHVVSLLLVLSMGVDYGVFLAESREHPKEIAGTVLSLLLCCVSTVLAFGLLGMSENPALRAIGLTTGLGVLLSLILAPSALILLVPGGAKNPGEHPS